MPDDNKLPKPVTMTGTAFDDADDLDSMDPVDDNLEPDNSDDPSDLPMPVVFGDEEEDDDEQPLVRDIRDEENIKEPEALESVEPEEEIDVLEDINNNFEKKQEDLTEKTEISSSPDLDSNDIPEPNPEIFGLPVKISQDDSISFNESNEIKSEKDLEEPELIKLESEPEPEVEFLPEPKLEPEPELILNPEPVQPVINKLQADPLIEDKTKFSDEALVKLHKASDQDLVGEEDFEINPLDHQGVNLDQETESEILSPDDNQDDENEAASNDEERINPFTAKNITPADQMKTQEQIAEEAKKIVGNVANIDKAYVPDGSSKNAFARVGMVALSLFLGGGLVVGGYYAAQNFFGSPATSIPIQAPVEAQAVTPINNSKATPVAEEKPPKQEDPIKPSPTPKEASKSAQTSKYSYVVIKDTPTGYLNARASADTKADNLIKKIKPGELFKYLGANDTGWFQIELEDGQEAWISGKYATKLTEEEYQELKSAQKTADTKETEEVIEEETEEDEEA